MPSGCRRIRSRNIEQIYLEALGSSEQLLRLRPVARHHTLDVAKQLARAASWQDATSRPTRTRICGMAGISLSTWQRARRRLEDWGYLGVVWEGTTPRFRPMALFRPDARNSAAVYVLCVPAKIIREVSAQLRPQTDPPTKCDSTSVEGPLAKRPVKNRGTANCPGYARTVLPAMAGVMRKTARHDISDERGARIGRRFAAAGWTARDLAWAIDHEPGGAQHRYTHAVRHPAGWLASRLGQWTDDHGVMLSRSQQLAVSRQRGRAARARHRTAMTAAAAGWTDPAPRAAVIRAEFGWKSRGAS